MVTVSGPVMVLAIASGRPGPISREAFCLVRLSCSAAALSGVPSWNDDAGPQGDGADGEVGVGGDRLGQVGLDLTGGRDDGQGIEHGAPVEVAALVPAGRGRIESALLGVDAKDDGAAPLGLGGGDPVASRTVGEGRAGPIGAGAQGGQTGAQGHPSGEKRAAIKGMCHCDPPRHHASDNGRPQPCTGDSWARYNSPLRLRVAAVGVATLLETNGRQRREHDDCDR